MARTQRLEENSRIDMATMPNPTEMAFSNDLLMSWMSAHGPSVEAWPRLSTGTICILIPLSGIRLIRVTPEPWIRRWADGALAGFLKPEARASSVATNSSSYSGWLVSTPSSIPMKLRFSKVAYPSAVNLKLHNDACFPCR